MWWLIKFKRLEGGRPLNVESRGQGFQSNYFYIYEFMRETKDAAAAREDGDKMELGKESHCWIGWAGAGAVGLAVEQSLRWGVHSPTRLLLDGGERTRCRRRAAKQGVPEWPNPLRRRILLWYSERLRKNRSIRGFRSFAVYIYLINNSWWRPRLCVSTWVTWFGESMLPQNCFGKRSSKQGGCLKVHNSGEGRPWLQMVT